MPLEVVAELKFKVELKIESTTYSVIIFGTTKTSKYKVEPTLLSTNQENRTVGQGECSVTQSDKENEPVVGQASRICWRAISQGE